MTIESAGKTGPEHKKLSVVLRLLNRVLRPPVSAGLDFYVNLVRRNLVSIDASEAAGGEIHRRGRKRYE